MKHSIPSPDKLFNEIKLVLEEARNKVYRAANFAMVQAYWNIGRLIVEDEQKGERRAEYGKAVVKELSARLTKEMGKGFTPTNLWYMRQFHSSFQNLHSLRGELSWTHYRLLLKVEKPDARSYYMQEAAENRWSTRTLDRQISSLYYERILASNPAGRKAVVEEAKEQSREMQPSDLIKDPYMLDFLDLKDKSSFREQELEQALVDKLQEFLLELGKGFSFVARQQRISMEDDNYYVDLVFYNYLLKCFVLADLKTGKLSHQDLGQMDMYVRYYEDVKKRDGDHPTIGLILCSDKNSTMARYSLLNDSKTIFASKYKTYLPTEEELSREIERGRQQIEIENKLKE